MDQVPSDAGLAEAKAALRTRLQARLEALGPERRREESTLLAGHLGAWAPTRGFRTVLATLPLAEEPDLGPWLAAWLAQGGQVALARTGPGRSLAFHRVTNLEGPWDVHRFGMREPPATLALWEAGEPTLCLVPGLGFGPGPTGGVRRLGRGAGYYDRWLGVHGAEVFALGVGFSVQTTDAIPVGAHDRPLDGWVDPSGLHWA